MKSIFAGIALFVSSGAWAGGYSSTAVPTRIDVVRNDGFMVYGAFANIGGCSNSDQFFVKIDHPQYKQLYAMALTAYLSKQKIIAYIDSCQALGWYSVPTVTFNILSSGSALHITD